MENKISFTKDILKQVSTELDLDIKIVEEVYNSMMMYLEYLVNKTSAVAIFIPNLGTLHLKVGYLIKKLDSLRNNPEKNKEKIEVFEEKKNILDLHIQKMIDEKYKNTSRHLQKGKIAMYSFNSGKSMDEIEEIQNAR